MAIKLVYQPSPAVVGMAAYAAGLNKSRIRQEDFGQKMVLDQRRMRESEYLRAMDWQQRGLLQNERLAARGLRGQAGLALAAPEQQLGGPDPNNPLGAKLGSNGQPIPLTAAERVQNNAAMRRGKALPNPLYVPPRPLTAEEQRFEEHKNQNKIENERNAARDAAAEEERKRAADMDAAKFAAAEAERKRIAGVDERNFGATQDTRLGTAIGDLEKSIAPGGGFELPEGVAKRVAALKQRMMQLDENKEGKWTEEDKEKSMRPLREEYRRLLSFRTPKAKKDLTPEEQFQQEDTRYKRHEGVMDSIDSVFSNVIATETDYLKHIDPQTKVPYTPDRIKQLMEPHKKQAAAVVNRKIGEARRIMQSARNDDGTPQYRPEEIDAYLVPYISQLDAWGVGGGTSGGPAAKSPPPAARPPARAPAPAAAPTAQPPAADGPFPGPAQPPPPEEQPPAAAPATTGGVTATTEAVDRSKLPRVSTPDDMKALPPGTRYVAPDGSVWETPRKEVSNQAGGRPVDDLLYRPDVEAARAENINDIERRGAWRELGYAPRPNNVAIPIPTDVVGRRAWEAGYYKPPKLEQL